MGSSIPENMSGRSVRRVGPVLLGLVAAGVGLAVGLPAPTRAVALRQDPQLEPIYTKPRPPAGNAPQRPAGTSLVIWQVSDTSAAATFAAWAKEEFGASTSVSVKRPDQMNRCVLAIVGPRAVPPAERKILAEALRKGVPVMGVGAAGLQVLRDLDPAGFKPASRTQLRGTGAAVPAIRSANLVAAGDDDPNVVAPRTGITLYSSAASLALMSVNGWKDGNRETGVVLTTMSNPQEAVVAWKGRLAFWGASEAKLLKGDVKELFQIVAAEVSRVRLGHQNLVNQFAMAELFDDEEETEKDLRKPAPRQEALPTWQAALQMPAPGPVTSPFGKRFHPILKYWRPHQGIDIGARQGAPVEAAFDGQVTKVGYGGGWGNRVVVAHKGGWSTLYAHLSAFAVREGDIVRKGVRVGAVGQTGLAKGPHLHFEVRRDGAPENPTKFIVQRFTTSFPRLLFCWDDAEQRDGVHPLERL